MKLRDLAHHFFINRKPPRGIDQHNIVEMPPGMIQGLLCDHYGACTFWRWKKINTRLCADQPQLINGGRPIDITRDG